MTLSVTLRHRAGGFLLDVAFQAPRGVTALFGHSGSGKTTVVNAVAGLLRPNEGRIALDGQILFDSAARYNLPPHKRHLGYVFQEGRLFPHLNVRQNLTYGRRFSRAPRDPAREARLIEMLGIGALLDRRPAALSGGEKQRVAIGRALLPGPRLLLMDEPLAALDDARKIEILPYLEHLRDEADIPILYVSHALDEVARLATTIVILKDGRVVRADSADAILSDPDMVPAIGLREAGSLIYAHVLRHHEDGLSELETSGGRLFLPQIAAPPGSAVRVRIFAHDVLVARTRPENISALNILRGTITAVHQGHGPGVLVQITSGDDRILARLTRRSAKALELHEGVECFAIAKSVSVARGNVGQISDPR